MFEDVPTKFIGADEDFAISFITLLTKLNGVRETSGLSLNEEESFIHVLNSKAAEDIMKETPEGTKLLKNQQIRAKENWKY
ncbi:unnamed protein product [Cunninghamella echinulata]